MWPVRLQARDRSHPRRLSSRVPAAPATLDRTRLQEAKREEMGEFLLTDVDEGVALLTFNRPGRMNAWTAQMEDEYFTALEQCARAASVRAIVVTGAGSRAFCAGADMQDLQALGNGAAAPEDGQGHGRHHPERERRAQTFPLSIPKPIVAAINGACAGIGLVQALMCDVRFAADDAKITTAFARRGLVAEHGISWILPRLVGPGHAMDLLLSARVVLGREAARIGLVNRALPREQVLEQALAYARDLALNCSPASLSTIKRQIHSDLQRNLSDALHEADRLMLRSFTEPDFNEGVNSFLERREPRFAPLGS
jgi:enoyl-CoA hydratase/carnithine racemase